MHSDMPAPTYAFQGNQPLKLGNLEQNQGQSVTIFANFTDKINHIDVGGK